jgi:hypothetical protein
VSRAHEHPLLRNGRRDERRGQVDDSSNDEHYGKQSVDHQRPRRSPECAGDLLPPILVENEQVSPDPLDAGVKGQNCLKGRRQRD